MQHLAEIIRTVVTEPDVLDDVAALARSLDKTPVICGDKAGFIANALLLGYLNHAVAMYEAHYASREDIDAAMRFGCGYPMGPLALLDLIGLDTAYEILDTMYKQGRDRLHAPAPILKQMVTAGMLDGDRPRLRHLRGPRQPGRRHRRVDPRRTRRPAAPRRPPGRWSAPGRWPAASSRCSRSRRHDVTQRRPQPGRRWDGVRATIAKLLEKDAAGSRRPRGTASSPGSTAVPASTTSPRWTSWSRRSPRTSP